MPGALQEITLQPQVRDLLLKSIQAGRTTHAYLFAGPVGCGKQEMAYAFAQALLCESHGCGQCEACTRVAGRKHPDVHLITPEGAAGYLAEQVREVVADACLAPIQAKKKVYILHAVERMNAAAANAFLKTLEEPTESALFILLTTNETNVLPTILSRCQLVRFQAISEQDAIAEIVRRTAASSFKARVAYHACGGSIELAAEFCGSDEMFELRDIIMKTMLELGKLDNWQVLKASTALQGGGDSLLDATRARQEEELELASDFLSRGALKQLEAAHKRQLTAQTRQLQVVRCTLIQLWLRDVLLVRQGKSDLLVNTDYRDQITALAQSSTDAGLVAACAAVDRCVEAIGYNVSLPLCFDSLLYEVREDVYDSDRTSEASFEL